MLEPLQLDSMDHTPRIWVTLYSTISRSTSGPLSTESIFCRNQYSTGKVSRSHTKLEHNQQRVAY